MTRAQLIRLVTILTVLGVAGIAAIVSYSHMRSLGERLGESWRAGLIPFSVDGLIVAASMVLVDRRLRGLSTKLQDCALAWAAIGVGVTASLIANMAHATTPGAMAWSAWPAAAFAGAFELLLQLFRAQEPSEQPPVEPAAPAEPVAPVLPAARYQPSMSSPLAAPVVARQVPVPTPEPAVPPRPAQPRVPDTPAPEPAPVMAPVAQPAPVAKPPARPRPEPKPTTSSVVVPMPKPVRKAPSRVSKPSKAGPTAAQVARVRSAVRKAGGRVGRTELKKQLPDLSDWTIRLALEQIRGEEKSAGGSAAGVKSRRASGGTR